MPEFTNQWFSRNRRDFDKHILPWAKGKLINYLEIGVYEGASLRWVLESLEINTAVGVDPWAPMNKNHTVEQMEGVYLRAQQNLAPWLYPKNGIPEACRLIRQTSADFLRDVEAGFKDRPSLDLAYIDGVHEAAAVKADVEGVAKLMRPGGWIIFDDVRTVYPNDVAEGIKAWLRSHPAKLAWRGAYCDCYQV